MKRKYSIGFFVGMLSLVVLLNVAYNYNYQKTLKKYELALAENEKKNLTVTADGTARKESGYYLKEHNGYVMVYLHDEKTIYADTNITMDSLPVELQEEIKKGKYVETTESLYGFLENYTS